MELGGVLKDQQVNFGANVGAGLCVSLTYNSFVLDGKWLNVDTIE